MPHHPESHIYVWSQPEMRAIKDYATAAVLADRAALAQPSQPACDDLKDALNEMIFHQLTGSRAGSPAAK